MNILTKLVIREILGTTSASTPAKAKPFLDKLCDAINSKQTTSVDFSGLTTITTAFLNSSIGQLYSLYNVSELNKYIKLNTLSLPPFQKERLQMVIKNAKQRLSQAEIEKVIDES